MALVKHLMFMAEAWELLCIALSMIVFVVYLIFWQVKWCVPSLRRRMIEQARQKRREEEQARRGKYGPRQYRA